MFSLFLFILSALNPNTTVLENYADSVPEICPDSIPPASSSSIDEAELLRQQYRQKMDAKNCIGTKAADFNFINRNGKEQSLHSIKSDSDILLLFYDPDCDDCHQTIQTLTEKEFANKISIVAIDSEEDRQRWHQTAHQLPDNWTVGFATDPIQDDETYYILSMPTLYLLDKDKKVILKDASLNDVLNLF